MSDVDGLLEEGAEAGILLDREGQVAFAHPQVRHVLFHTPSRRARERLHLRIADRLEERGDASAAAIAHHLTRAGSQSTRNGCPAGASWPRGRRSPSGPGPDAAIAADTALAALGPEAPWDQRADLHSLVSRAASHDFDLAVASRHGGLAVDLAEAHGDAVRWAGALIPLARTLATNAGDGPVADPTPLLRAYLTANPEADGAARAEVLALLSEIRASYDDLDGAADAAAEAAVALPENAEPELTSSRRVRRGHGALGPTRPAERERCLPASPGHPGGWQRRPVADLCRGAPGVGQPAPRTHRPGGARNTRAGHHAAGRTDLGGARAADGCRRVGRRRARRARPSRARPRGGRAVDEPLWLRVDSTHRVSGAGVRARSAR